MDEPSLFDPNSTLRYLVVQHVHALKGTCFGRVARSFFLHSGEGGAQVDCFFPRTDAAEAFLAVLQVEHAVRLVQKQVFGTNTYRVTRATSHGVQCSVEVNIVAYHQGLSRRGRLPRNIPMPLFDIDHVFWEKGSVVSTVPALLCDAQDARAKQGALSHILDRCMRRQFAAVNPLPRRVPDALLVLLDRARDLVVAGFTMDDSCGGRMPVVQQCNDPTFECVVQDRLAPAFVVQLPCSHLVSHEGMVSIVQEAVSLRGCVACPVCQGVVCARNADAEGVL